MNLLRCISIQEGKRKPSKAKSGLRKEKDETTGQDRWVEGGRGSVGQWAGEGERRGRCDDERGEGRRGTT